MRTKRCLVAVVMVLAVFPGSHGNAQAPPFAWARQVAGTLNDDRELAVGLAIDAAANLYVTGWFDGTNDFGNGVALTNTPGGGEDMFVAKYDSTGRPLWARKGGGNTVEWDAGRGVGVDGDGNVYVTGQFYGEANFDGRVLNGPADDASFFLAKYSGDGDVLWVRQSAGGDTHYSTALAVDGRGNCYAVGYIDDFLAVTFDEDTSLTNPNDAYGTFLVKYDSGGNSEWAVLISSSGQTYSTSAALDVGGGIYVSGAFQGDVSIGNASLAGTGLEDGYLAKFDRTGTLQWLRHMSTSSYGGDPGGVAGADAFGNVYVAGGFGANAGDTICFGPSTLGPSICLTHIGGGLPGVGVGDGFLAKYNSSSGTAQWAVRSGGTNADFNYGVAADSRGNVFAAGAFGGFATSTEGLSDASVVVANYDSNGVAQWTVSSTGTNGAAVFAPVVVDAAGNCYVAGWFQTSEVFGSTTLNGRGYFDFFLAKIGTAPVPLGLGIQWNDTLPCLSVVGEIGSQFVLEYTPTLPAAIWHPFLTNTLATVPFIQCDASAGAASTRFYRARLML